MGSPTAPPSDDRMAYCWFNGKIDMTRMALQLDPIDSFKMIVLRKVIGEAKISAFHHEEFCLSQDASVISQKPTFNSHLYFPVSSKARIHRTSKSAGRFLT